MLVALWLIARSSLDSSKDILEGPEFQHHSVGFDCGKILVKGSVLSIRCLHAGSTLVVSGLNVGHSSGKWENC